MEVINWAKEEEQGTWQRPNLVAYALIETMSEKAGRDIEEVFKPFIPEALKVEFKVNGVDLNFTSIMDKIQKSLDDLEKECKESVYKEVCEKVISDLEFKLYKLDH